VIEIRRIVRLFLLTASIFSFILPQLSNAFTIFQSWQHPRVVGKFWRLPSTPAKYHREPDPGILGAEGVPEDTVQWNWDWEEREVKVLRRYDVLFGAQTHVISYDVDDEAVLDTAYVDGEDLSHELFFRDYNHDERGGHGGSRQDLLAKSRWGLIERGYDQVFFSARDLTKVETDQMKTGKRDHPREELVDWLSPGWFCFGAGDYLREPLTADGADTLWIWIEDSGRIEYFKHGCWGRYYDDNCAAIREENWEEGWKYDVWERTYIMILPPGYEDLEIVEGDSLPRYEVMRVIGIDDGGGLEVVRSYARSGRFDYPAGSEVRPLVWSNPNSWGDESIFMNASSLAPTVTINGQEYRWYDIAALFVKHHDLKSYVSVKLPGGIELGSFYLSEGLRLDAYQRDGVKDKMAKCSMFLHSEVIDLDLDNEPDCPGPGGEAYACGSYDVREIECTQPGYDQIRDAWREGYIKYLNKVREYAYLVRGDEDSLYIVTNGFPDTTRVLIEEIGPDPVSVASFVNGRYYEDANGGFQDTGWVRLDGSESGVYQRAVYCDSAGVFREPRYVVLFERDRDLNPRKYTNLAMMRLTMAVSLLLDEGYYGTTGSHNSRVPLFEPGFRIEDYYDEYAVDREGRGFRNPDFQDVYWDSSSVDYLSEDLLFEARYYLGEPMDTAKVYSENGEVLDVVYREYDHGLVIVDFGILPNTMVRIDSLDLVEDPRENFSQCRYGCHFMKICGDWRYVDDGISYNTRYNDGANDCTHGVDSLMVEIPGDDGPSYWGASGDAVILLKEGDGFDVYEECRWP